MPGYRRDPHRPARRRILADDAATFILIHKQPQDPAAAAKRSSSSLGPTKGAKMAEDLDYVPMPARWSHVEKVWAAKIKDAGGKPIFALSN